LIDAHAHLTDAKLADDLDAVIARASAAGITRILTCGEDVASSERALELARRYPRLLRVAVGIHPHRASSCDDAAIGRLRELASDPLVVAIGEIGLDQSGRSESREAQEHALSAQLVLAGDVGLPVVLHMREASEGLRAALDGAASLRGQLHCYSDTPEAVLSWTARGLWLSFAGTVTFAGNGALREAAQLVPTDRILAETDAPYLAPEPRRGKRCEPAFVVDTVTRLAAVRGVTGEALAATIEENARALFGARWM